MTNLQYLDEQLGIPEEDKKNIGLLDVLGGTAETALYIPQALGSVLLSALEGGVSKAAPESWGGGTFKEGFDRGLERYNYQPQTESGKASTDVVNKGMEYLDWPFQQFGEGVEYGSGLLGASPELADAIGRGAYWGTSLLSPLPGGPTKGLLSAAKGRVGSKFGSGWGRGKIAGSAADKSQIHREGWYKDVVKGRNPLAVFNTAKEMVREGLWQSLSPVERHWYKERGMSRMSQEAIEENMTRIRNFEGTDQSAWLKKRTEDYLGQDIPRKAAEKRAAKDLADERSAVNKAKRNVISDYSNQYVMKTIYDPDNPAIQPGTPLYQINEKIFPSRVTTNATEMNQNPSVISEALGLKVEDDVARHISSRITERFTPIQDGKPVVLAHRTEGVDVTGGQMRGVVHTAPQNPQNGLGLAWDRVMSRNEPVTLDSLNKELSVINREIQKRNVKIRAEFGKKHNKWKEKRDAALKFIPKADKPSVQVPKEPKIKLEKEFPPLRKGQEENGLISYEFAVNAGPDPLTGSVDVIGVFNPRTGKIFQVSMDRMALGAGLGIVDKIGEMGAKQHWISLTPAQTSVGRSHLTKHGLDNESLLELAGVSPQTKGLINNEGYLTPKGRGIVNNALEQIGEASYTGTIPKPITAKTAHGMMPQQLKMPKRKVAEEGLLAYARTAPLLAEGARRRNENR